MARITVEDCLTKENNRFALVQLAAKRTKQILRGSPIKIADQRGNKAVVTALREIAVGQVRFLSPEEAEQLRREEEERAEREAAAEEAAPVVAEVVAPIAAEEEVINATPVHVQNGSHEAEVPSNNGSSETGE